MRTGRRTVVCFDVETDCLLSSCPGATRDQQCFYSQITVACALVLDAALCEDPNDAVEALATSEAFSYWQDDASGDGTGPFEPLLQLMDEADVILVYNGFGFDYPVLRKYYGGPSKLAAQQRYVHHRLKTLDPFDRIRSATGEWPKLDALLQANGLASKTASGVEAITMWQDGRRRELEDYCAADVKLMAELCLQPDILLPRPRTRLPNVVYGIAAAVRGQSVSGPEGFELIEP